MSLRPVGWAANLAWPVRRLVIIPEYDLTVAQLFEQARRALGTQDEASAFMTTPHPKLAGRSPMEAAQTELGARRVERVLNALEYGLAL